MADDNYTVKINRRDGAVEITGSDKEWIAEQLDKLAIVYNAEPAGEPGGRVDDATEGNPPVAQRRKPRARSGGGGSRAKAGRPSPVMEKLDPGARKELEAFVAERDFKGTQKQAAIIATFLED